MKLIIKDDWMDVTLTLVAYLSGLALFALLLGGLG
jgi:hypothetical protein